MNKLVHICVKLFDTDMLMMDAMFAVITRIAHGDDNEPHLFILVWCGVLQLAHNGRRAFQYPQRLFYRIRNI